jgi:hypothetical protein
MPDDLSPSQYVERWLEAYEAGEQLLLAGLAREVGPGGDLASAYRRWAEEYRAQHDQALFRMMERLDRRERRHAQ